MKKVKIYISMEVFASFGIDGLENYDCNYNEFLEGVYSILETRGVDESFDNEWIPLEGERYGHLIVDTLKRTSKGDVTLFFKITEEDKAMMELGTVEMDDSKEKNKESLLHHSY